MVKVSPALSPHRGSVSPPAVVARQQHLDRFRERRLARPVPSDDQSQPGPWIERKGGGLAHAPEPLDREGSEIRARRLGVDR